MSQLCGGGARDDPYHTHTHTHTHTHLIVEFGGALQRGSGVDGAEVIETWEHRTRTRWNESKQPGRKLGSPVVADIKPAEAGGEARYVLGGDPAMGRANLARRGGVAFLPLQEVNVVLSVEATHVVASGAVRSVHLHTARVRHAP